MKTIFTLLFVLSFTIAAQAQNNEKQVKVVTLEMPVVTTITIDQVNNGQNTEVARLYKFKNSRIKAALSFATKKNRSKLA